MAMFGKKKPMERSYEPTPVNKPVEIIPEPEPIDEPISEPEQEKEGQKESEPTMFESDLTASISRNSYVDGSIDTKDNLDVFGIVKGNISSEAVVKVYGEVTGDINCLTLIANGSKIVGNIFCEKSCVIGDNTYVKGDIKTENANISGSLKGNLLSTDATVINMTAVVVGNIITGSIEVGKGAQLMGAIRMETQEEVVVTEVGIVPEEIEAKEESTEIKEESSVKLEFQEEESQTQEVDDADNNNSDNETVDIIEPVSVPAAPPPPPAVTQKPKHNRRR